MIPVEVAKRVLSAALRNGGDLAELYVENTEGLSLTLDDGRLEKAVQGADNGSFIFRSRRPRLHSNGNPGPGILELRQESQKLVAAFESFTDQPVRGERGHPRGLHPHHPGARAPSARGDDRAGRLPGRGLRHPGRDRGDGLGPGPRRSPTGAPTHPTRGALLRSRGLVHLQGLEQLDRVGIARVAVE